MLLVDEEGQYAVAASIGVVPSWAGADLESVLARAEVALSAATAQGMGRTQTWRPGMAPLRRAVTVQ